MVERQDERLVPADDASLGHLCSMSDMGKIFSDLLSPSSRLLRQEYVELLFTGQLAPASAALAGLRGDDDNYGFCAGKLGDQGPPSIDWCPAGLLAMEELPVSKMPRGL